MEIGAGVRELYVCDSNNVRRDQSTSKPAAGLSSSWRKTPFGYERTVLEDKSCE